MHFLSLSVQKNKISDYLKDNVYQFYISPNLEAPLKFIFTGFPQSSQTENIKKSWNADGLYVYQVVQMKSMKDGKILPLFLLYTKATINQRESSN